jgi:hypothetical protein
MSRASTRRLIPLAISGALIAWLFWRVPPAAVLRAAEELNWVLLIPATIAMVVCLYVWDAACLPVIYGITHHPWSYARSLQLRGLSYLGAALHYELGQGIVAWMAAKTQNTSVVRMLARCVILMYHDVVVLLALGLFGSWMSNDSRVVPLRPWLAIALAAAAAIAVVVWAVPTLAQRFWSRAESVVAEWSIKRSLMLIPMRVIYFGILVVYAAAALAICHVPADRHVVLSTVPLVMLADGLPSVSGLGTRETALQLLLQPDRAEMLLALSLVWSAGLILGRAGIGLALLWWNPSLGVAIADATNHRSEPLTHCETT